MKAPALEVRDLTVAYDHEPVLRQVELALDGAQLVGVIGPNGAGKSTLLKAIMGLVPLSSGQVKVHGEPLSRRPTRVVYVPQRDSVDWDFPVSARDVVMMGRYGRLGWFARPGREDHRVVDESLDRVGMLPYARRQISQLSGGQQQRIFLARALAQQGEILLLDEPFVGIDAATERALFELLRELRGGGRLALVVHHDLESVRRVFDSVLLINQRLVASGPTPEVFTPALLRETYGGRLALLSDLPEEAPP